MATIEDAAAAIERGELVVYPTETVYGLGADALDPDAIERAYAAKGRDRAKPMSLGVPDVDAALDYVRVGEREEAFMREFLPGPVTVVCEKRDIVPDSLVGGRDRVGIRVPDHDLALDLLEAADTPVTATSANRSGRPSVRHPDDLDPDFREDVAIVLDGGETDGVESTVVDVAEGVIHREGANADAIVDWLASARGDE
ncbi:L-threonylcarbamoyladenylate synthase [Halocalculus aciditolerans]|uniref:L-threonylcarbamoyladenylate synthase n=1 Tax=Halocalculus aciditolerans TaxID=1383812 RepID=A0A830F221_9EURY|nr:L-threonylcarbamoyladenylate synthase [Halocalculus aciditolerans]GGL47633.1 threonylcarbamoyl-AMP synthase [Halocalculus aciditolerans]